MNPDDRLRLSAAILFGVPALCWFQAVRYTGALPEPKTKDLLEPVQAVLELLKHTHQKPVLLGAALGGLALALLLVWALDRFGKAEFAGVPFKRHLRGTRIVGASALARMTKDRSYRQVSIAGIPVPRKLENLHFLVTGSPGAGKSVLLLDFARQLLLRGDRMIVVDPSGDMLKKFYRPADVILNPNDARTAKWSVFNEIRNDFDFERYARSMIPGGATKEAEEWAGYGRSLFSETARKMAFQSGDPPLMSDLFSLMVRKPIEELHAYLKGTPAESQFRKGAEKPLGSTLYVLGSKLAPHLRMPPGDFSLRTWLETPGAGTLWLTWREDMGTELRPLISAWVDILCSSILSMPAVRQHGRTFADKFKRWFGLAAPAEERPTWLFIDELASMENLASLFDALTKGRKHAFNIVCGVQSIAQLDEIYGRDGATILRSCFGSLLVFRGARSDSATTEEMSKSLGEHEVERFRRSRTSGRNRSVNTQIEHNRERVVMPAEIAGLPALTGYVALAGNYPIAKVKLKIPQLQDRAQAFVERTG